MKSVNQIGKTSLAIIAIVLASSAAPVLADDASTHAGHHPASAVPTPVADAASPMMGEMKTMQDQMDKIHAATDPKVRAQLMDEHMKSMQATMQEMMKNGGCMGADMPMQGGMGKSNMMQMMMDQMMQHQNAMQPPAK